MSNEEILEKAIQKAIDGGWDIQLGEPPYRDKVHESIIFNHDFAKSIWGEEPYYRFDGDTLDTPRQWQYHLQQMVIAEEPIKYLGENI